jgi:hypothetical protein
MAIRDSAVVRRYAASFARFWWDFLIGDTPELFVGTLAVIGAAFGLRHDRVAAIVVVPAVALAFLFLSTLRGRTRS